MENGKELKNGYYLINITQSSHYIILRYMDGKWYIDDTTYYEVIVPEKANIYSLTDIKNIERFKSEIENLDKQLQR